jgi:hypothetical protein
MKVVFLTGLTITVGFQVYQIKLVKKGVLFCQYLTVSERKNDVIIPLVLKIVKKDAAVNDMCHKTSWTRDSWQMANGLQTITNQYLGL